MHQCVMNSSPHLEASEVQQEVPGVPEEAMGPWEGGLQTEEALRNVLAVRH